MKNWLFQCMTIFVSLATFAQPNLQLRSPDNKILIGIKTDPGLTYSVFVDEKKILNESVIDMSLPDGRPHSASVYGIFHCSESIQ